MVIISQSVLSCTGHDWSKFIEYTVVNLEGDTTEGAVERREKIMREKIKEIIPCDASRLDSSFFDGEYATRQYDIVHTNTVFESVLESHEAFQRGVAKLASHVKPGGYLQLMMAVGCDWYTFPGIDKQFYVLNLNPDDGIKAIEKAGEFEFEGRGERGSHDIRLDYLVPEEPCPLH